MEFKDLLKEYTQEQPKPGQIIVAEILQMNDREVLLDVGAKRDAVAPAAELEALDQDRRDRLSAGDRVPLFITHIPAEEGQLRGSIRKGVENEDWVNAQNYLENEEILSLEVLDHNRGGLLVKLGALVGFVPNSHIHEFPRNLDKSAQDGRKEAMIESVIPLQVIEVDPIEDRLILSHRLATRRLRHKRLREFQTGDVASGTVVNLVDFGAFVNLGGVNGLIHISEMSWDHVEDPSEVLSVNDEVDVYIKEIDLDRKRIGLSLKALEPSPWETIDERLQVGDLVEGEVVNVRDFGAFVRLAEGLVGLIHRSEMELGPAEIPSDLFERGDVVQSRVERIDPHSQRIGLSVPEPLAVSQESRFDSQPSRT